MSTDYFLALSDHYKAVRARLNAGTPRAPVVIAPPPPPPPPLAFAPDPIALPPLDPLPGVECSPETKRAILPVLHYHGLTWAQIAARNNRLTYVRARTEIYMLLRERGWSYPQIGRLVGGRDHTTIVHSVQRYHARKETK